jgi:hypothetical protein
MIIFKIIYLHKPGGKIVAVVLYSGNILDSSFRRFPVWISVRLRVILTGSSCFYSVSSDECWMKSRQSLSSSLPIYHPWPSSHLIRCCIISAVGTSLLNNVTIKRSPRALVSNCSLWLTFWWSNATRHCVQTGSGAHPAPYTSVTVGYFPGGKAAGAWSWPLTSSAEVRNADRRQCL